MRTIRLELSSSGIERAIRELEDYKRFLERKTEELRKRIGELIMNNAQPVFMSAIASDLLGEEADIGGVEVSVVESSGLTIVIANGKDAVFMEFGAGVYHNGQVGSSPHPLGNDLGFTIGSYGLGNGARQVWGFRTLDGTLHLTHGTPASMPLYNAEQAVIQRIEDIAREVFQS